jgi:hypothetical protein
MTKKDYELIAKVLKNTGGGDYKALMAHGNTCATFAEALAKENPRFNSVKFLEACGMDGIFGKEWRKEFAD